MRFTVILLLSVSFVFLKEYMYPVLFGESLFTCLLATVFALAFYMMITSEIVAIVVNGSGALQVHAT